MCWITYDEVNASGVSNAEGALVLNMWALKKQRVGRDSARAAVALVPPDLCGVDLRIGWPVVQCMVVAKWLWCL